MVNDIIDNNILTIDSLESKFKMKKFVGGVRQDGREGYNLFNSDKALTSQTKTQGGATVTKNNDKSFTVTGSGNLTGSFGGGYIDYTHEETLKILKTGQYTCYFGAITYPLCAIQFFKKENDKDTLLISRDNSSNIKAVIDITDEIINSTGLFIRVYLYGASGRQIVPGTIYPMLYEGTEEKPFEGYGATPSPDYPSEVEAVEGSLEINKVNKNIFTKKNIIEQRYISNNGDEVYLSNWSITDYTYIYGSKYISYQGLYDINSNTKNGFYNKNKELISLFQSKEGKNTVEVPENTYYVRFTFNQTVNHEEDTLQIELGEVATDYTPHESEVYNLPIQQPMLSGDTFVKEDGNWFEVHGWEKYVFTGEEEIAVNSIYPNTFNINLSNLNILPNSLSYSNIAIGTIYKPEILNDTDNIIMTGEETNPNRVIHRSSSFSELEGYKQYLKNQYNSGTPAYIWYKLATPTKLPCTPEQIEVLEQLNNCYLYDGITNFIVNSDVPPIIEYNILKLVEDTDYIDFYISSNGYLVIPEYNIKYLIDFNSSSIPSMPEAVESSVRIAGRDGDEVLNTTYEPMQFSIVCYTYDNLTQSEKVLEERKINQFLNSIKNDRKTFAIEKDGKFYKVKYNSLLTTINFPKHLQFTIPLKSSDSYAKDLKEKTIIGNQTVESDTIKEVGCLITIEGPAQTPKIYLNDYEMIFNNAILQGNRLEINTSNSTITHISNEGVKTNAMVYYNHEFPKIKYGDNTLRVESGIDNERQVSVKWYDLKL